MGTVVLYAIALAHINAYKTYYASIGITFVVTMCYKLILKSGGNKEIADMVGLGGMVLTVAQVVNLLAAMKHSGFQGDPTKATQFLGGAVGKMVGGGADFVRYLLENK